jgi:hypothetical protein
LIFGLLGLQNPFADQWTWLRIYTHTQLYMLNQNNFSLWWSPINASRSMWQNYPNSRHYMPRKLAFCALKSDDLLVCVCVCVCVCIQVPYLSKFSFVFFIFFIQQCCIYMKKEVVMWIWNGRILEITREKKNNLRKSKLIWKKPQREISWIT